jgi:hypothetical protein
LLELGKLPRWIIWEILKVWKTITNPVAGKGEIIKYIKLSTEMVLYLLPVAIQKHISSDRTFQYNKQKYENHVLHIRLRQNSSHHQVIELQEHNSKLRLGCFSRSQHFNYKTCLLQIWFSNFLFLLTSFISNMDILENECFSFVCRCGIS